MCKYNPKKNKSVVLISTQHRLPSVVEITGKPEIILFYNSTKAGVDTLDQLVRCYSTKRPTRRWPMSLFYNVLDSAAYNAYCLYITANSQFKTMHGNHARREFLKLLAEEMLEVEDDSPRETPSKKLKGSVERGFCCCCKDGKKKRTRSTCELCLDFVCESHRTEIKICNKCKNQ